MRHIISALSIAALQVGCPRGDDVSADKAAPAPSVSPAPITPDVPAHMAEHATESQAIRAAVIAGDLDNAKQKAKWMAEHVWTENLAPDWKPYAADMQRAAQGIVDAGTLAEAAGAVSNMGLGCAKCHEALGRPKITIGEPPAPASGAQAQMQRHAWADERLWLGLVTPSDEAWKAGAAELAKAPLAPATESSDSTLPPEVSVMATRLREAAERAATMPPVSERSRIYGDFLGACAECHKAVGAAPKTG